MNLIKKIFSISSKPQVKINILTRTSNRPKGFQRCRKSIESQSYKNIRHIVSYDNEKDLDYLSKYKIHKIRVSKESISPQQIEDSKLAFKPYNLYCNQLLREVDSGWIMFLDDDDYLANDQVVSNIAKNISKANNDTLLIWQTQYPNGVKLPSINIIKRKEIIIRKIDTACFIFHSKYKDESLWDCWWAADFRFVKKLSEVIPKRRWIREVYTKKSTMGGTGKRKDII
jgi:hypothetical protein